MYDGMRNTLYYTAIRRIIYAWEGWWLGRRGFPLKGWRTRGLLPLTPVDGKHHGYAIMI